MAILIATNPEPFTRQYIWACFIKTAKIICPEKAQELKNTSLSRNTVAEHINIIMHCLGDQLKFSSKIFQTYIVVVDESTDAARLGVIICGCNPKCVVDNCWNRFLCRKLLMKKTFSVR